MAEVMPINFPLPSESAVASYNWVDVAEGTGIIVFYPCATLASKILTTQSLASDDIEIETSTAATGAIAIRETYNHDLAAFNTPRTIKGKGVLSVSTYQALNDGAGSQTKGVFILKKNTDTIVSVTSTVRTGNLSNGSTNELIEMDIPETHFAIGDVLRLTVEAWMVGRTDVPATILWGYGADPLNRDGTYIIPSTTDTHFTQSKLLIPFKIDL